MKKDFTKYLKDSCCYSSDEYFCFKFFFSTMFSPENFTKIVRLLFAAASINEMTKLFNGLRNYKTINSSEAQLELSDRWFYIFHSDCAVQITDTC